MPKIKPKVKNFFLQSNFGKTRKKIQYTKKTYKNREISSNRSSQVPDIESEIMEKILTDEVNKDKAVEIRQLDKETKKVLG